MLEGVVSLTCRIRKHSIHYLSNLPFQPDDWSNSDRRTVILKDCHSDRREESKTLANPNHSYRRDFRPFTIVQGDIVAGYGIYYILSFQPGDRGNSNRRTVILKDCHSDRWEESKTLANPNHSYRQDFRPFTIAQGDIAMGKDVHESNFSSNAIAPSY